MSPQSKQLATIIDSHCETMKATIRCLEQIQTRPKGRGKKTILVNFRCFGRIDHEGSSVLSYYAQIFRVQNHNKRKYWTPNLNRQCLGLLLPT